MKYKNQYSDLAFNAANILTDTQTHFATAQQRRLYDFMCVFNDVTKTSTRVFTETRLEEKCYVVFERANVRVRVSLTNSAKAKDYRFRLYIFENEKEILYRSYRTNKKVVRRKNFVKTVTEIATVIQYFTQL